MASQEPLPSIASLPAFSTLLGWWRGAPLGTLLVFLAECRAIQRAAGASALDIAIDGTPPNQFQELHNLGIQQGQTAALSLLAATDGINRVFAVAGADGYRALCREAQHGTRFWPEPEHPGLDYDTTERVQKLWRESGDAPLLKLRAPWLNQATERVMRRFDRKPVVSLHLKNVASSGLGSASAANQTVWADFLRRTPDVSDAVFVLVGDDPVSEEIASLPHVALGRDLGAASFAEHLALIAVSNGFMGMMSALCNMALFSRIPYTIFKNPSHHREEMLREIGAADHYCFATPDQKIYRVDETPDFLFAEFHRMKLDEQVSM